MHIIALVGQIACGKSTVVSLLRKEAIPCLESDEIVAGLYVPHGKGTKAILAQFPQWADASVPCTLSKPSMIASITANPALLDALDQIMTPLVREERRLFLAQKKAEGCAIVVFCVPLIQTVTVQGLHDEGDFVVLVQCEEATRRMRAIGRGISEAHFLLLEKRQWVMSQEDADLVLTNTGTMQELETQVGRLLQTIRQTQG